MSISRLECSICMDSFKDPRLISCHHSFCYKCLEDHVRVNLSNGHFKCPLCRESVKLPWQGVSGFKRNFYIESKSSDHVANIDSDEKFACDICGPKNVACSRCLDCEENLCQLCCYVHEKSKASRQHKISDLGTLDSEMKGKLRQRTFCDQHTEEEIKVFCQDCKVLICSTCKSLTHANHSTRSMDDTATEVRKTLQTKLTECSNKLRCIKALKTKGEELDGRINDAEREEIKAVEDQRSQLIQKIYEEEAKMIDKIKNIYHDLRQQNEVFKRNVQDEFTKCSTTMNNVQKLTDLGTNIEIIKNGPDLEKLISDTISRTDQTPITRLNHKLFSPAKIKPIQLTSMIGIVQDATDSGGRIATNPSTSQSRLFEIGTGTSFGKSSTLQAATFIPSQQQDGRLTVSYPVVTQSSLFAIGTGTSFGNSSTFLPTTLVPPQQQSGRLFVTNHVTTQPSLFTLVTSTPIGKSSSFQLTSFAPSQQQSGMPIAAIPTTVQSSIFAIGSVSSLGNNSTFQPTTLTSSQQQSEALLSTNPSTTQSSLFAIGTGTSSTSFIFQPTTFGPTQQPNGRIVVSNPAPAQSRLSEIGTGTSLDNRSTFQPTIFGPSHQQSGAFSSTNMGSTQPFLFGGETATSSGNGSTFQFTASGTSQQQRVINFTQYQNSSMNGQVKYNAHIQV